MLNQEKQKTKYSRPNGNKPDKPEPELKEAPPVASDNRRNRNRINRKNQIQRTRINNVTNSQRKDNNFKNRNQVWRVHPMHGY